MDIEHLDDQCVTQSKGKADRRAALALKKLNRKTFSLKGSTKHLQRNWTLKYFNRREIKGAMCYHHFGLIKKKLKEIQV